MAPKHKGMGVVNGQWAENVSGYCTPDMCYTQMHLRLLDTCPTIVGQNRDPNLQFVTLL